MWTADPVGQSPGSFSTRGRGGVRVDIDSDRMTTETYFDEKRGHHVHRVRYMNPRSFEDCVVAYNPEEVAFDWYSVNYSRRKERINSGPRSNEGEVFPGDLDMRMISLPAAAGARRLYRQPFGRRAPNFVNSIVVQFFLQKVDAPEDQQDEEAVENFQHYESALQKFQNFETKGSLLVKRNGQFVPVGKVASVVLKEMVIGTRDRFLIEGSGQSARVVKKNGVNVPVDDQYPPGEIWNEYVRFVPVDDQEYAGVIWNEYVDFETACCRLSYINPDSFDDFLFAYDPEKFLFDWYTVTFAGLASATGFGKGQPSWWPDRRMISLPTAAGVPRAFSRTYLGSRGPRYVPSIVVEFFYSRGERSDEEHKAALQKFSNFWTEGNFFVKDANPHSPPYTLG